MKSKLPIAKTSSQLSTAKPDDAQERRWKAEDALRTVERYNEIMRDKPLVKDMKACAREKIKALKNI